MFRVSSYNEVISESYLMLRALEAEDVDIFCEALKHRAGLILEIGSDDSEANQEEKVLFWTEFDNINRRCSELLEELMVSNEQLREETRAEITKLQTGEQVSRKYKGYDALQAGVQLDHKK